jgi:hypothetical protein
MKKKLFVFGSVFLYPFALVRAFDRNVSDDVGGLTAVLGTIVALLIPIASMLAILFFFYGLALYILKAGDPKAADEGKSIMIWGIVALFVMTSIYGIIGFIQRSSGMDQRATNIQVEVPNVIPSTAYYTY